MNVRTLLILGLALLAGGCSSMADKVIARVGGPERGFLTPDFLTDAGASGSAPVRAMANGCTPTGCPQAPGFCAARGYQPGTEGYDRCLISVAQNLRSARR
ncbi:MAG: hypothetical protein ISS15_17395 [Alphaproteobacteria bacterium]|nr:hypothetical protein [Alphaproteobacteria bacterium]MBL7099436.1 hypothetical protein [Alphaproteobacteria bacterium]